MKIGLYFGSFNPIHVGHLIIANHCATQTNLDKVWFVLSPHNPLKESSSLLNEYHRLHLVNLSIEDAPYFKASNVEFKLPKPSYTVDTLAYLKEQYPKHEFCIIMGGDSFQNIAKWKNYKTLLAEHEIYIYNRPGFEITETHGAKINLLDAPLLDISSTAIRQLIKEKKSIKFLVASAVEKEIEQNNYYKQ